MSEIRMSSVTEDQIKRAYALARKEAGVYRDVPGADYQDLTRLQQLKIAALANSAIITIVRADAEGREVRP